MLCTMMKISAAGVMGAVVVNQRCIRNPGLAITTPSRLRHLHVGLVVETAVGTDTLACKVATNLDVLWRVRRPCHFFRNSVSPMCILALPALTLPLKYAPSMSHRASWIRELTMVVHVRRLIPDHAVLQER